MKNKDVIQLTNGLFQNNWADSFRKGCPIIDMDRTFKNDELLEYFEMWQKNPKLSKDEILDMSKDGVPLKIYRKEVACIYFLISNNEIVYVGRSINIASRLYTHINEKSKDFDSISLVDVGGFDQLVRYEWPYIAKFMPKYNFPKNTPEIISKMNQLLWVQKVDMVGLIKDRIANT